MLEDIKDLITEAHQDALDRNYTKAANRLTFALQRLNQNKDFISQDLFEEYEKEIKVKSACYKKTADFLHIQMIFNLKFQFFLSSHDNLLFMVECYKDPREFDRVQSQAIDSLKEAETEVDKYKRSTENFLKEIAQLKKEAGFSPTQIHNTHKILIEHLIDNNFMQKYEKKLNSLLVRRYYEYPSEIIKIKQKLLSILDIDPFRPTLSRDYTLKKHSFLWEFRKDYLLGLTIQASMLCAYGISLSIMTVLTGGSALPVMLMAGFIIFSPVVYDKLINWNWLMDGDFRWWLDIPLGIVALPMLLAGSLVNLSFQIVTVLCTVLQSAFTTVGNFFSVTSSATVDNNNPEQANEEPQLQRTMSLDSSNFTSLDNNNLQQDKPSLKRMTSLGRIHSFHLFQPEPIARDEAELIITPPAIGCE